MANLVRVVRLFAREHKNLILSTNGRCSRCFVLEQRVREQKNMHYGHCSLVANKNEHANKNKENTMVNKLATAMAVGIARGVRWLIEMTYTRVRTLQAPYYLRLHHRPSRKEGTPKE